MDPCVPSLCNKASSTVSCHRIWRPACLRPAVSSNKFYWKEYVLHLRKEAVVKLQESLPRPNYPAIGNPPPPPQQPPPPFSNLARV
ncbi:hypothetical protein L211DRAFT_251325 [Terfezia boudieri ATCC MYA-4762]|uniref:Uncharacterized protein n=1 Tax=Terfezia boudieri ATCC MYA-4762 TaxID=1051890 RepID=A0A3N4M896_9PEZI|nr:hypothetical protein L211DRAFT_251325 [Terfezia boudieri ATCC MYA-4762]